jgi:hypothetical protein
MGEIAEQLKARTMRFSLAGLLKSDELQRLIAESHELAAIMSSSYGTARYKERNKRDRGNG